MFLTIFQSIPSASLEKPTLASHSIANYRFDESDGDGSEEPLVWWHAVSFAVTTDGLGWLQRLTPGVQTLQSVIALIWLHMYTHEHVLFCFHYEDLTLIFSLLHLFKFMHHRINKCLSCSVTVQSQRVLKIRSFQSYEHSHKPLLKTFYIYCKYTGHRRRRRSVAGMYFTWFELL